MSGTTVILTSIAKEIFDLFAILSLEKAWCQTLKIKEDLLVSPVFTIKGLRILPVIWVFCAGLICRGSGSVAGDALQLQGVNQYFAMQFAYVRFDRQFTFEAWVRLTNYGTYTIFSSDHATGLSTDDYVFQIGGDGRLRFFAGTGWDTGTGVLPLNEWVHVAATYDERQKKFYINGELDSVVTNQNIFARVIVSSVVMGRQAAGCACNYFVGRIDEPRVWSRVRTEAEIRGSYRRRLTGLEPGLEGYYRLDEQSGAVAADSSPAKRDAKVFGSPTWVISDVPLETSPAVSTLPASSVRHNGALLNGAALTEGLPTTGWFEWGTTTNYGNVTPNIAVASNSSGTSVMWTVGNLEVAATYHYRFVVTNANDQSAGMDGVFATPVFEVSDVGVGLGGDFAAISWGDYNVDGWLDYAVSGVQGDLDPTARSGLMENGSSGFNDSGTEVPQVAAGSIAWGDYNNDNRPDLLMSGQSTEGNRAELLRNRDGGFEATGADLPKLGVGSFAWGDFDNDGRLDLLVAGRSQKTAIFRNTGNGFTNIGAALPKAEGLYQISACWGDYDNDGQLDILFAVTLDGSNTGACQVWRNTGAGFSNAFSFPVTTFDGVASWGDYDNDGLLDILFAGRYTSATNTTMVLRNTGNGFAKIPGNFPSWPDIKAVAWGDYDNDGQLDMLLAGPRAFVCRPTGESYEINLGKSDYRDGMIEWGDSNNDGRLDFVVTGFASGGVLLAQNFTPETNSPPSAPSGLAAISGGDRVFLKWNAASDAQTPATGLNYNLRVGTSPGGFDVVSPMADTTTGKRYVASRGAIQTTNWFLRGLIEGQRYYWSVQAIDTAFTGGAWSAESSFIFDPIRLNGPVRLADGRVRLTFTNHSARPGHVWGSTDLNQWTDLGAGEDLGGGTWGFVDEGSVSQRFYRVHLAD